MSIHERAASRGAAPQIGLLVAATLHLHCATEPEPARRGPGSGGVRLTHGDGGASHGGGGGGGGAPATTERCEVDWEQRECRLYNAYGCISGFQTCVDGTWSACFWEPELSAGGGDVAQPPSP